MSSPDGNIKPTLVPAPAFPLPLVPAFPLPLVPALPSTSHNIINVITKVIKHDQSDASFSHAPTPHPLPFIVPVYFIRSETVETVNESETVIHDSESETIASSKPVSYLEYLGDDMTLSQFNTISEAQQQDLPHESIEQQFNPISFSEQFTSRLISIEEGNLQSQAPASSQNMGSYNHWPASQLSPPRIIQFEVHEEPGPSAAIVSVTTTGSQTDRETFECEFCDAVFTRRDNLTRHTKSFHIDKRASFPCSKCGKEIKRYDNYLNHKKTCGVSAKSDDYPCAICSKKFLRQCDLKRHKLAVHFKSKPFKCEQCDFTASYKHIIKRHVFSTHKPSNTLFICSECGVDFVTQYRYEKHSKSNCTNQIPVEQITCSFCRVNFTSEIKLNSHLIKVHKDIGLERIREMCNDEVKCKYDDVMIDVETPMEILPSVLLSELDEIANAYASLEDS